MASICRKINIVTRKTHFSGPIVYEINHCGKHFCLCVEYLDFGKKKDREKYRHCYITQKNNERYEIDKKKPTLDEIIRNYLSYQ